MEKTAIFTIKSSNNAAWYKVRDKLGREGYIWSGSIYRKI